MTDHIAITEPGDLTDQHIIGLVAGLDQPSILQVADLIRNPSGGPLRTGMRLAVVRHIRRLLNDGQLSEDDGGLSVPAPGRDRVAWTKDDYRQAAANIDPGRRDPEAATPANSPQLFNAQDFITANPRLEGMVFFGLVGPEGKHTYKGSKWREQTRPDPAFAAMWKDRTGWGARIDTIPAVRIYDIDLPEAKAALERGEAVTTGQKLGWLDDYIGQAAREEIFSAAALIYETRKGWHLMVWNPQFGGKLNSGLIVDGVEIGQVWQNCPRYFAGPGSLNKDRPADLTIPASSQPIAALEALIPPIVRAEPPPDFGGHEYDPPKPEYRIPRQEIRDHANHQFASNLRATGATATEDAEYWRCGQAGCPQEEDKPPLKVRFDGGIWLYHCFACAWGGHPWNGDAITLAATLQYPHIQQSEAVAQWIRETAGMLDNDWTNTARTSPPPPTDGKQAHTGAHSGPETDSRPSDTTQDNQGRKQGGKRAEDPPLPALDNSIFEASPQLAALVEWGHYANCAPWGLLAGAFCYINAQDHWTHLLDGSLDGTTASIYAVALGASGRGKGRAMNAIPHAIRIHGGTLPPDFLWEDISTPEGVYRFFQDMEKPKSKEDGGEGGNKLVPVQKRWQVLLRFDEMAAVYQKAVRDGNWIFEFLSSAYLGHWAGKNTLRDPLPPLARNTHLSFFGGIQLKAATKMLYGQNSKQGFADRLTLFNIINPDNPPSSAGLHRPAPIDVQIPKCYECASCNPGEHTMPRIWPEHPSVDDYLDRLARSFTAGADITHGSHEPVTLRKLAKASAVFHGNEQTEPSDLEIALMMVAHSNQLRDFLFEHRAHFIGQDTHLDALAQGQKQAIVSAMATDYDITLKQIGLRLRTAHPHSGFTRTDIKEAIHPAERTVFTDRGVSKSATEQVITWLTDGYWVTWKGKDAGVPFPTRGGILFWTNPPNDD